MTDAASPPPRFLRLPVSLVLVGGLSALMLIAVSAVLALSFFSARANTLDLLRDRADIGLELLETRVRGQLDPVAEIGTGLAGMFFGGLLAPDDEHAIVAAFQGALAAAPQVTAIFFIDGGMRAVQVSRGADPLMEVVDQGIAIAGMGGMTDTQDGFMAMLAGAADMEGYAWLPPLWVQNMKQPVLNLEVPVQIGGEFAGVIFAVVELGSIVAFLEDLRRTESADAFILYGRERLLAHPRLFDTMLEGVGAEVPLAAAATFDDPALAGLGAAMPSTIDPAEGEDRMFTSMDVGDKIVTLREIGGYGDEPWQIGLTFDAAEVNRPLAELQRTALLGLLILAISVALAMWMGRTFSRRIAAMCDIADRLARMDVATCGVQPRSRLLEFDEASRAFNAMTRGLRWFETYVPKSLVLRLMSQADLATSQERILTVMFTDIRGFSTMSERMSATEVADLLNHHFETLSTCIEAEDGTVDKFIGDSVMAFWGAPEHQPDHAARALRAARCIQQKVEADNERRRAEGKEPIFVRVGLHSGSVVVGNIGSQSRVNYTVVGDTVNAASRLESLAKEIGTGTIADADECVVLFSEETGHDLEAAFDTRSLGSHTLRGRAAPVEVFQLLAAPPLSPA